MSDRDHELKASTVSSDSPDPPDKRAEREVLFARALFGKDERPAAPVLAPSGFLRFWDRVKAMFLGKWMPAPLSSAKLAFVTSFLNIGVAIAAALFAPEILGSTRDAFPPSPSSSIAWGVVFFWAALLVAIIAYYLRAADQRFAREQMLTKAYDAVVGLDTLQYEILRTTRHFADQRLFAEYSKDYEESEARLLGALVEDDEAALGRELKSVLSRISRMASRFARADFDAGYGANIMLCSTPPFEEAIVERLQFIDRSYKGPDLTQYLVATFDVLLYLPAELAVTHRPGHRSKQLYDIALPVPKNYANTEDAKNRALPGASYAFLTGETSLVRSTAVMADRDCQHMPKDIREEVRQFFTVGMGRDIKSFVSFQIHRSDGIPVGVLNIDSDASDVLGPEQTYHPTFHALIKPMLRLLERPVVAYAAKSWSRRILEVRPAGPVNPIV